MEEALGSSGAALFDPVVSSAVIRELNNKSLWNRIFTTKSVEWLAIFPGCCSS